MQELLKFKLRSGWGRPYVLVRWAGCNNALRDTWELLDNLTNCEEAISTFEPASESGRPLPGSATPCPAAAGCCRGNAAHMPIPQAGFTIDAAQLGDLCAELVGRTLLYWCPADGWQRGTVARLCPRGAFPQVVAYTRPARRCSESHCRCGPGCRLFPDRHWQPDPPRPGRPPVLTFRLVSGSSQLSLRLGPGLAAGPGRAGPGLAAGPAAAASFRQQGRNLNGPSLYCRTTGRRTGKIINRLSISI